MKLESDKVTVQRSADIAFSFLKNMNNWEQLMPDDKVSEWQSTDEECSFNIKGMSKIGLKVEGAIPNSEVNIVSSSNKPISFQLNVAIEDQGESSIVQFLFEGSGVNPFMQNMISIPLKNFFNLLGSKLSVIEQS